MHAGIGQQNVSRNHPHARLIALFPLREQERKPREKALVAFRCTIVLEGALRDLSFRSRRTLKCRNTTRRSVDMNVFYVPAGHVTDRLFVALFFSRFSKPYDLATADFIDELDAGILKCASYDL